MSHCERSTSVSSTTRVSLLQKRSLRLMFRSVWKAAHRVLPTGRRYLALRAESDQFLQLVRELNTAALAVSRDDSQAHKQAFEEVRGAMRKSVERMVAVAGKTNAELESSRSDATRAGQAARI